MLAALRFKPGLQRIRGQTGTVKPPDIRVFGVHLYFRKIHVIASFQPFFCWAHFIQGVVFLNHGACISWSFLKPQLSGCEEILGLGFQVLCCHTTITGVDFNTDTVSSTSQCGHHCCPRTTEWINNRIASKRKHAHESCSQFQRLGGWMLLG